METFKFTHVKFFNLKLFIRPIPIMVTGDEICKSVEIIYLFIHYKHFKERHTVKCT